MDPEDWQFWIDVGGTFTDCLAMAPSGKMLRHKTLSSGVTKGAVGPESHARCIVDVLRRRDPLDFWRGCRLHLLDAAGQTLETALVASCNAETGQLELEEPLSSPPLPGQAYELDPGREAPLEAIRYLLGLPLEAPLPSASVRLGTTQGTNALLTRTGAPTLLVATRGFADCWRIGYQDRPRLFDLCIKKPAPLYARVIEIEERLSATGETLQACEVQQTRILLQSAFDAGLRSAAVCLLNAYRDGRHEKIVGEIARDVGFEDVSLSHQAAPFVKLAARGDTTLADAYLNPVLRDYLGSLQQHLGERSHVRLLTSAGGLTTVERFTGKDSILSGPAGGVLGFSRAAEALGERRVIGFDMGGTSTDVARYDGRYEYEYETMKAGVRIVAPMLAIETVAAGGGSICRFHGGRLVVGPQSAGAAPGPACYGRGGPLTITDMNLVLGRIPSDRFPFPLDQEIALRRLDHLAWQIQQATGRSHAPEELAEGFIAIANNNMAGAIRTITLAKGCDPREYLLAAFGGAAPQHACSVARELGVRRILNHPQGGVLSAYGIGLADATRHRAEGVYGRYSAETLVRIEAIFSRLGDEARSELLAEGVLPGHIEVVESLDVRYVGLEASLHVRRPADGDFARAYAEEHERIFGYAQPERPLEIVAARVEAIGRSSASLPASHSAPEREAAPVRHTRAYFQGAWQTTPLFERERLQAGDVVAGPAIITETVATTIVEPGWRADVLSEGELVLTEQAEPLRFDAATEVDPTLLEVFHRRFSSIAEQMGVALRNTSMSVNVKERLDFSCALFTPTGDLVANAPHIPVHLGAMSETVRRILADNPDLAPGDVYATNDPFRGGSHLPDVTIVSPVHDQQGELLFFTASRAHHAEIGGIAPGSMPPFSTNLAEEGVLIRNFKLSDQGQMRYAALRALLLSGPFPTRSVDQNMADVAAQVAANRRGAADLLALAARYSLPVVQAYMAHIQQAAEMQVRAALERLPNGVHTFEDYLDDGSKIKVSITLAGDSADIDFTGTAGVSAGNLNANTAIVSSAVMYCLRCLVDDDIPLNQGVLAPVVLHIPEGLLHPPEQNATADCAAVAGGNVETSQRIVDVLLGALGVAAASQGTMNNVLFGDATFGYYETVCGGAGATPNCPGADAVHTHMTNTRLTDTEVLEQRFPVRVKSFRIRRGSGGAGVLRGGNGVVRELEFLKPLELSLLTSRRGPYLPYGLAGGGPGQVGRNTLLRAGGGIEVLPAAAQTRVAPGDVLRLETPGGGGYGAE